MRTVKVSKADLFTTLQENSKTHKEDFEIAWEKYREKAIHNAENLLDATKNLNQGQEIQLYINLQVPIDHSEDYKRAIQMLEWEIDDEVELSEAEFKQYVQDEWGWSASTKSINTMYTGSESPSKGHI